MAEQLTTEIILTFDTINTDFTWNIGKYAFKMPDNLQISKLAYFDNQFYFFGRSAKHTAFRKISGRAFCN